MTTDKPPAARFYALDCVRAAAILLGVFYHALMFGMMGGGGPPGMGRSMGPMIVQGYLHSFRMPLFFLISGFFSRMMLEKYGTRGYLARRWTRIGLPLLVGLFTLVPLYLSTRPGMGGPPGRGPGGPPGSMAEMPAPPPGFVPPPMLRFDEDRDGSLSESEWKKARAEMPVGGPGRGGPPPGFGGKPGWLGPMIFGSYSRLFQLEFLWFLWYLLVFATAGPIVAKVLGWVLLRPSPEAADRLSRALFRYGAVPIGLGVAGGLVLSTLPSMFGWSMPIASGIFRATPDFLLHLEPDMGFYVLYFLVGWWLHRGREALPGIAKVWLPLVVLGFVLHASSSGLGMAYMARRDDPSYDVVRLCGYTLYGIGGALTAFGFLGFFQRYVDRPSKVGRYLADTAFWVYVVHEPVMTPFLIWLRPMGLPWWAQGLAIAALTTAGSLLLYELIVRPTPLVRLFGPGGSGRNRSPAPPAA